MTPHKPPSRAGSLAKQASSVYITCRSCLQGMFLRRAGKPGPASLYSGDRHEPAGEHARGRGGHRGWRRRTAAARLALASAALPGALRLGVGAAGAARARAASLTVACRRQARAPSPRRARSRLQAPRVTHPCQHSVKCNGSGSRQISPEPLPVAAQKALELTVYRKCKLSQSVQTQSVQCAGLLAAGPGPHDHSLRSAHVSMQQGGMHCIIHAKHLRERSRVLPAQSTQHNQLCGL